MNPKEPIALIQAKGKKHLTKAEIAQREAEEPPIIEDEIEAPSFLKNKKQKDEFEKLSNQLRKIKVMSETDCDTLGRYILSKEYYDKACRKLNKLLKDWDNPQEIENVSKLQDRYFRQVHTIATSLGLTITSRCKLVVPSVNDEEKKKNKFEEFEDDD